MGSKVNRQLHILTQRRYFKQLASDVKFFWIDGSDLLGETYTTATVGMSGVQRNFITEYTSSTDNWKFIFPTQSWGAIENADNVQKRC